MGNDRHTRDAYSKIKERGGYITRSSRGILEVRGSDRATWLNNLVTNTITTLSPGDGNYAFAANIKGRTVFDLNMLVLKDMLWLDLDRGWIETAMNHMQRYVVMEDVQLCDISDSLKRIAVMGPAAQTIAANLGFEDFLSMVQLQHATTKHLGNNIRLLRNDYAGLPCAEFFFDAAADEIEHDIIAACEAAGIEETIARAVEIFRIEAGIPRSRMDINEEVIPPETGRIEQGISRNKGCYLGQEVIERIRSQGMVAKRLVGLQTTGAEPVTPPARIKLNGEDVGRVTSACWSEQLNCGIAMGYIKAAFADSDREFAIEAVQGSWSGHRMNLPICESMTEVS